MVVPLFAHALARSVSRRGPANLVVVVPGVLLAASAVALVPAATSFARASGGPSSSDPSRPTERGDRFFATGRQSNDDETDEVRRLRRENAELREDLRRSREEAFKSGSRERDVFGRSLSRESTPSSSGGSLLGALGDGLRGLLGGRPREETALEKSRKALDREIDEAFRGTGLVGGLVGSVAKGLAGMAASAFAETAADVDRVQRAVADRLERDGALGGAGRFESDAPTQQSYSSSSINGRVAKAVTLVYRVTNARSGLSGLVRVEARLDAAGNVDILDLELDNRPQGGGRGPPGSGGGSRFSKSSLRDGTVIDV